MFFLLVTELLVAAVLCGGPATAERPPTKVELRAAYCIPLLQVEVAFFADVVPGLERWLQAEGQRLEGQQLQEQRAKIEQTKQIAREREAALHRLQLYLWPRVAELEPPGVLAATNRAQADLRTIGEGISRCESQCSSPAASFDCLSRCVMVDAELQARLDGCHNPSWLPF